MMENSNEMKLYTFNFTAMTTPCEVQIYETDEKNAINCFEAIKQSTYDLEHKYSFYEKDSYLNYVINNRKSNLVLVDHMTKDILHKVKELASLTDGLFDITIGTIKSCYEQKSLKKVEKCKRKLLDKMGTDSWSLEKNRLSFLHDETKFDLGGVIKEFAVDLAGEIVREFEIDSALINYGGDILSVGRKPDGNQFCIGIKNPHKTDENLLFVNIEDQALTTSASYERSKTIEGKNFSHILSKDSLKEEILSSTIISSSTLESGVFSTSFMIDPSCNIVNDMKVVLIDKNLNIHQNLVN